MYYVLSWQENRGYSQRAGINKALELCMQPHMRTTEMKGKRERIVSPCSEYAGKH